MRCPFCKNDNDKVIDTRPSEDGSVIRRRRECLECSKRFTTHERLEEMPVRVIKKSGRREPFDRTKILNGVMRAVEKRSISLEMVEKLVESVEREVLDQADREISTKDIGELVMAKLRAVDEVAYVRFASVYREYQALEEFIKEIQTITPDDDGLPIDPEQTNEENESPTATEQITESEKPPEIAEQKNGNDNPPAAAE